MFLTHPLYVLTAELIWTQCAAGVPVQPSRQPLTADPGEGPCRAGGRQVQPVLLLGHQRHQRHRAAAKHRGTHSVIWDHLRGNVPLLRQGVFFYWSTVVPVLWGWNVPRVKTARLCFDCSFIGPQLYLLTEWELNRTGHEDRRITIPALLLRVYLLEREQILAR